MKQETEQTTPSIPPKIEVKSIKHLFTPQEVAQLNVDFRGAFGTLKTVLAEFDAVKASYKAKTTEAESRMETLNATLQAGFEIRPTRCRVLYRPKDRKKDYFLEETPLVDDGAPVLIEDMSAADFEQDLIQAESKFEARDVIQLFQPTATDGGELIVGRLKGKWFSALRIKIGNRGVRELLDSEQKSVKKRADAVRGAAGRAYDWLIEALGKDAAKGFQESITSAVEAHKEREE